MPSCVTVVSLPATSRRSQRIFSGSPSRGTGDATLTQEALRALEAHDWPGNARAAGRHRARFLGASSGTLTSSDLGLGSRP
jgi:hypothetical protein